MMKLSALTSFAVSVQAVHLAIGKDGGNATSPYQYGIMFEEIDHAGEGGLYAELLMNRAFQGGSPPSVSLAPWTPYNGARLTLRENDTKPLSRALPVSVNVAKPHSNVSPIGLSNPGFWGIAVLPQTYQGTFWVRGDYTGNFTASLWSLQTGETFASTKIPSSANSGGWIQYNFTLQPSVRAADAFNQFTLSFDPRYGPSLDFSYISLFPPTWHNRPNGMRPDLVDPIAHLRPSFLRFAGGSNLLGLQPPSHWRWNNTIGPLIDRKGYNGAWQYENTNGLGLAEFLDWCEDLDMEPLLAIWDGVYIDGDFATSKNLDPLIQDTLNEIEYITGNTSTTFGALRASHGREKPWRLRYVEIGNEDWLPSYSSERWPRFWDTIHSRYPELHLMSSSVFFPLRNYTGALEDFHLYARPDYLVENFGFFDQLASDHKILVGELAVLQYNNGNRNESANFTEPHIPAPFWAGSVAEAIYYIGLERNTDKIWGTTYFSLLENFINTQWSPGLIRYNADPTNNQLTTSYQVLKLFSQNRFTETLPVNVTGDLGPAYWVAGRSNVTQTHMLKAAVYNSTSPVPFTVSFTAVEPGAKANLTILSATDPLASVSATSDPVQWTTTQIVSGTHGFEFQLPGLSVALLCT